jgi:hypothetical protein
MVDARVGPLDEAHAASSGAVAGPRAREGSEGSLVRRGTSRPVLNAPSGGETPQASSDLSDFFETAGRLTIGRRSPDGVGSSGACRDQRRPASGREIGVENRRRFIMAPLRPPRLWLSPNPVRVDRPAGLAAGSVEVAIGRPDGSAPPDGGSRSPEPIRAGLLEVRSDRRKRLTARFAMRPRSPRRAGRIRGASHSIKGKGRNGMGAAGGILRAAPGCLTIASGIEFPRGRFERPPRDHRRRSSACSIEYSDTPRRTPPRNAPDLTRIGLER